MQIFGEFSIVWILWKSSRNHSNTVWKFTLTLFWQKFRESNAFTLWKTEKFTLTKIFFPLKQLFSDLFSKCGVFTKFLPKMRDTLIKILTVIFSRMAMLSFQSLGSQFSNSDPSSSKLSFTNELTCSLEGLFSVPY